MAEDEKNEELASVPFYIHEAILDKVQRINSEAIGEMSKSNRRMLIALIVVCVTLLVTVLFFLRGYDHLNASWIETYDKRIEEIYDGNVLDEGN